MFIRGEMGILCWKRSIFVDTSIKIILARMMKTGIVIKKANDQEEIIYVDIDLSESMRIRDSKPYTQLRRTELYK